MNLFLKKLSIFLFIGLIGIICIIGFLVIFCSEDIPAFNFTNSYSFNDKLSFVHERKADIIAIGSSMTLNNVETGAVIDYYKTKSYLNLSSWGMSMKDIYILLQIYCRTKSKTDQPKVLLIAGNLGDLSTSDKNIRIKFIEDYFKKDKLLTIWHAIRNFELSYYKDNWHNKKYYKSSDCIYQSLIYDSCGGVSLNKKLIISTERWNNYPKKAGNNKSYDYLDSISKYCLNKKIRLIFFQTPVREGLVQTMDTVLLKNHLKKMKMIIKSDFDQCFVNSTDTVWKDSLFVDGTHLNKEGARLFTKFCLRKIPKRID